MKARNFLCLIFVLLCSLSINAQVTGTVFRDYNGNGTRDTNEPLLPGVTVNAYNIGGSLCGTATTTAGATATNYSLTGCGTGVVRVEFVIPASGSCVSTGLDYSSLSGTTYGSSVQFVNGNSTGVNFALHNPNDYNQGTTNVSVFIPCYISGDPLVAGAVANGDWFVGYPYTNTGSYRTLPPSQKINGSIIGSTWGVAYSKQAGKIFTSALLKRHTGLGSLGSGGIYMLTPTATSFTVGTFNYDLDANGHRTRAAAGAPAYGDGTSYSIAADNSTVTYLGANDPLTGQPSGLGVIGSNSDRGLTSDPLDPSYDPAAFDQVGKVGLGDLEISDDGKFLFLMNLYSRKVFRLELNSASNPTSVINVTSYDVPATTCTNGEYRPWALKFYRNKLYVGVTCSAENGGTASNLSASVYELNNPIGAATFNTSAVLTFPLDYSRSGDYNPWSNDSDVHNSTNISTRWPSPLLSDIEFTDNGDMVLGIMDRGGHQWGEENYRYLETNTQSIQTITFSTNGDVLVAGLNCGTGGFTLENNGSVSSANGTTLTGVNTQTNAGPGGKEFFDDNSTSGDPHDETATGAIAVLKGQGEVILSAFAQSSRSGDAGTMFLSTTNGDFVNYYELYDRNGPDGIFAKANGLGDIELSSIEAPIEIGNRVWTDTDSDGIQDAGEAPIAGLTVQLLQGTTVIATATTDASGNYYFSSAAGTNTASAIYGISQLDPNMTYIVRIPNVQGGSKQTALGTNSLTLANIGGAGQPDVRDSDGILVGNNAEVTVLTSDIGVVGANNHNFDFGFGVAPAAICGICPPELTITGLGFGSGSAPLSEDVTLNSGVNVLPENNIAGFLSTGSSEGVFYTLCTEISQPVAPLQNPYAHAANGSANGFTSQQALRIAQIFQAAGFSTASGFGSGNNTTTNMVAMQMAVWNAMYDTDFSITTGPFQMLTNNNPGVRTLANSWLAAAQLITSPNTPVHRLTNPMGQDLVFQNCITTEPGICNSTTNTYSLTGNISFANAPTTGTLTVSVSGGGSQVFNAPFTSPQAYNITGLTADGASHTVTAVFSADITCTATAAYNAPVSCTPTGLCNCKEYLYVNDVDNDQIHKFAINPTTGALTEIGNAWRNNFNFPHGLATDLNGFLYISPGVDVPLTKLTCDGDIILPDPAIVNPIMVDGVNVRYRTTNYSSHNGILYVHSDTEDKILAIRLCDGSVIGSVELPGGGNILSWGHYNDGEYLYIPNRANGGEIYRMSLDTNLYTIPSTNFATLLFAAENGQPMGMTRDGAGNFYVIENQTPAGSNNNIWISKYSPTGVYITGVTTATSNGENLTNGLEGWWGTRQLVWSETTNFLYLGAQENCVTVFDTSLVQQISLNIGNPTSGSSKTISILKECCPDPAPRTINRTVCSSGTGEKFYLQHFLDCGDGIVCEGMWTESANTSGGSIVYNECDLSITVNGTSGCATYILEKTTPATGNQQCGTFRITLNICISAPTATVTAVQGTCTGATANNDAVINITSATNANQAGISTGATYTGPSYNGVGTVAITGGIASFTGRMHNTQYTVRIFNGSNDCYADYTLTTPTVTCCAMAVTCTPQPQTNCTSVNGSASVSVSGAIGTVTYLWSSGEMTSSINNKAAGTYTVTVTDGGVAGCTRSCQAVITSTTTLPTATCSKTDNTNCGTPNGTASVTTDGNQIAWSTGANTASITGLSAGTYTVTVTNTTTGCTNTCQAVIINNTTNPTVTCSKTDNTNCATPNGSATATATGVTYLWSNNATTSTITGLSNGTYTVTVTSTTSGCTATCEAIVGSTTTLPTASCSSTDNTNCSAPNGTASVTTNANQIAWSTGANTPTITGLSNGTYTVTVTNTTTGCTNTCQAVVGSTTTLPTATCSKTDNTNCGAPNGTASVTTNGNQISWSTGANTPTITGLSNGTYTVTVTNTTTGCTNTCQAVVGSTITLPTASCSSTDNTNCSAANGTASVTTNGNQISWSTGASTPTITGLSNGTYTVTVTNTTTGCTNTCQAVVNNSTTNPTCSITANNQPSCANLSGGSITVVPSPAGTYTYAWSDGGAATATRIGLTGGTYTVTVTNTTSNCTGVCNVTLTTPTNCCNIAAIAPQNLVCLDNGTPNKISDNRIQFTANVTNSNTLLTTYNVTINGGTTITPNTNVPYGVTQFLLGPGTAGGGATFTVTVTDSATPGCTQTFQVTDPGTCNNTTPCLTPKCGTATIQVNGN